ncbi:NfeD family protein [Thermococcus sp. Bubb.Bath]|uniref:NfeD family protein n=1 Tax=Thermococcus sp. Bubb.Bath TaxID=1638242 RepID=UPI00143BD5F7|nr:NfeD family protein [Thermococcus sp. Bubb.Bath]
MRFGRIVKFLLLSVDEIIVGLFLVWVLPGFGVEVPLWAVASVIGVLIFKDILVAPFILRGGLSARPRAGSESLVGRIALVVEDLDPEGLVKVDGELWSAECIKGSARRGEVVKIVGVSGSKVLVERPEP